jgi:Tfp pilus assembly protein PilF
MRGWAGGVVLGIVCLLAVASIWYSIGIVRAEAAINRAFARANNSDLELVIAEGIVAANVFDPVGDYEFLVARALVLCADRLSQRRGDGPARDRVRAASFARTHAEASLRRTMTPDSAHLLLAYIALVEGDRAALRAHAVEAIRLDPNYPSGHWLMAEGYLIEGDRKQAALEARVALLIDPSSAAARSALKRARGEHAGRKRTVQETIEWGRQLASETKMGKARRVLSAALRRSVGPCPDCHGALASVYEALSRNDEAIREWQIVMREAKDPGASEEAKRHIETLKQKGR